MSSKDADADESPALDVEAVGVDEIVRQERVRAIFSAREACRKQRTKAKNRLSVGEPETWSVIYRNALESYVREVEPLFAQTDEGKAYWNSMDFGVMDVRPRYGDIPRSSKTGVVPNRKIADRDDKPLRIRLQGLRSLFDMDTPYHCSFDVILEDKRMGTGSTVKTVSVERYVPIRALDQMFSVVNSYLTEIGFGIQVDKAQQNTKLDDDLIEEVEQWRRENL